MLLEKSKRVEVVEMDKKKYFQLTRIIISFFASVPIMLIVLFVVGYVTGSVFIGFLFAALSGIGILYFTSKKIGNIAKK